MENTMNLKLIMAVRQFSIFLKRKLNLTRFLHLVDYNSVISFPMKHDLEMDTLKREGLLNAINSSSAASVLALYKTIHYLALCAIMAEYFPIAKWVFTAVDRKHPIYFMDVVRHKLVPANNCKTYSLIARQFGTFQGYKCACTSFFLKMWCKFWRDIQFVISIWFE